MNEYGMILIYFAGMMVFVCVLGYFALRFVRTMAKRTQEYYDAKEQLLENLIGTLSTEDIENYKRFPNQDARMAWLEENHLLSVERMPEYKIAKYLDVKLLNADAIWSEAEVLQRYLGYCDDMSLVEYQKDLDAFTLWAKKNSHGIDKEKLSAKLWESLSEEDRRRFKYAGKVSDRKRILAEANPDSSGYHTDYLFPIMISSYLGLDSNDSSYFAGSDFGGGSDSGGGGGDGGGGGGDGGGGGGGGGGD